MAKKRNKKHTSKKHSKKVVVKKSVALVPVQVNLTAKQTALIAAQTPTAFIRTRKGPGGTQLSYVEGGYILMKLNEIFGPLNWGFEVVKEETKELNEKLHIRVLGRLTVYDHKNGYKVFKDHEGSATMKLKGDDREYGDVAKAAATDALKKCASLYGIAADVYWPPRDEGETMAKTAPAVKTVNYDEALKQAEAMIKASTNVAYLIQLDKKVEESKLKKEDKERLSNLIHRKVDGLQQKN